MNRLVPWVLTLLLPLAAACTASTAVYGEEEVIVLEVAPDSVPCQGEMADMCLQVRTPGEEEWRVFFDPIEGFRHEPGVRYTLEVGRREVLDPPADASSFVYRLIEVLEREAVAP